VTGPSKPDTSGVGGPAPIPPQNRSPMGPEFSPADTDEEPSTTGDDFQNQDPKRRLGDFTGAGEQSLKQPSSLNDGTTHSK